MITANTWYRDSHGLFDYEEKQKLVISKLQASQNCKSTVHSNLSVHLKRDGDIVNVENFDSIR